MRKRHSLAAALSAVVLAACSSDNVVLQSYYNYPAYDYANFSLYHAGRDTKVDIYGNPFAMDASAFAKAVTDAMQGANIGRPINFTTRPGASAEKNLWVVMAFDTKTSTYDLCARKGYSGGNGGRSSGVVVLRAAWCFDGRQDSWVEAWVGGTEGPEDPKFRALVRQTVLNLFVPQDRFRDRDRRRDRRFRRHM